MRTRHQSDVDREARRPRWAIPLFSILAVAGTAALTSSISAAGAVSGPDPMSSIGDEGPAAFTECMRSNGLPDFPDVTISDGQVNLDPSGAAIDPFSTEYQQALEACESELPEGTQLPQKPSLPELPSDLAELEDLEGLGGLEGLEGPDDPAEGDACLPPTGPAD